MFHYYISIYKSKNVQKNVKNRTSTHYILELWKGIRLSCNFVDRFPYSLSHVSGKKCSRSSQQFSGKPKKSIPVLFYCNRKFVFSKMSTKKGWDSLILSSHLRPVAVSAISQWFRDLEKKSWWFRPIFRLEQVYDTNFDIVFNHICPKVAWNCHNATPPHFITNSART